MQYSVLLCMYARGVCLHVCSISIPSRPMFMDGKSLYYSHAQWNSW